MPRPVIPFLVATCILAAAACSKGPPPKARHLVLITIDTLSADRLGCYGGPNQPSPWIDRIAAAGIRFQDAYANRAMTLPSMTSFFTSKYPEEHGVVHNGKTIPDGERLLAERLQEAGFHTFCLNAAPVLGPGRGNIEQGFDPGDYRVHVDEKELTRAAMRYVERRFGEDGRREFLWLHYMNPHKPYAPPPPFDRRFTDPDYLGDYDGSWEVLDRVYVEGIELPPADLRNIEALYDGTVAFVDECVESVRRALAQAGHLEETLLVVAADHGEDLYRHNRYFYHANSPYRSSTWIPLVFHQPGTIPAGQVAEGIVESVDFLPTVLAWLGVPAADGEGDTRPRGVDLGAVLLGQGTVRKEYGFAQVEVEPDVSRTGQEERIYAVRNREWLYVYNPREVWPSNPPHEGSYPIAPQELYHVTADPDEQVNVLAEHPEVADRMYRALQGWLGKLVVTRLDDDLSAERREMLIQQGYLAAPGGQRPRLPAESAPERGRGG